MARKETPNEYDAIDLLEEQHRRVETLFDALSNRSKGREGRRLVMELFELLSKHSEIEERVFYPSARSDQTDDLVDDSLRDHAEIKQALLDLVDNEDPDQDLGPKLEELQMRVQEHVEQEETELFPKVRDLLAEDQLEALAQELTAAMVETGEEETAEHPIEAGETEQAPSPRRRPRGASTGRHP